MLKIHFSQNDMRNMMLIQQTLIQYLLQKKNLCDIFKVLTIWGNINLFIRPQHHTISKSKNKNLILFLMVLGMIGAVLWLINYYSSLWGFT